MDHQLDKKQLRRASRAKFLAMASSYCLGVFNDNYFKQADGPKVISVDGSRSIKEVTEGIMAEL